jgi:limonene 1,2-monooxygenase
MSLKFGVFLPPHHRIGFDATKQIHDDLDLMVLLDRLGFDEAWIGEHHSGGMEIISSPEVFIATAAERTKRIRLGTGVNSLPYHHPFILANRWVLLSHLTRGRAMFGAGPGQLPTDFWQMGLDLQHARRVMEESLEAIVALLEGEGPVTRETETFTLRDAQLHIPPYRNQFDLRVAASFSPAGPRAAGRFGLGMISFGATTPQGAEMIRGAWSIVEDRAAEFGRTVDRSRWGLVGAVHLAETVEQAHKDVHWGMGDFIEFLGKATPSGLTAGREDIPGAIHELTNEFGAAVIGTPDMVIETIERLDREAGGIGSFLLMAHDWADPAATRRSYELFAEHVMPHFDGTLDRRSNAYKWMIDTGQAAIDQTNDARVRAQAEHEAGRTA